MITDACCLGCRGATPMLMYAAVKCACHKAQDRLAKKSRGRPLYRDPTFFEVLSRMPKEKSNR